LSFDSPKGKAPEFVAVIRGASGLGPLALDTRRQRLFAADPLEGTVYVVNLTSHTSAVISTRLGEPRSLVFDESRHTLYVGDIAGRRVWKIDVDRNPPSRVLFASPSTVAEIPSPNGLALSPDGTLWVGGMEGERIVGLTRDGRAQRVIR
jgi:sugar lactone lactonase YvrE